MNSKNSSENIASSGDLSVQLTKTDIDHRIHEMKNKSSIESSTLYKTALFVVIGILIAFTSQCKLSLTSFIFSSFKVINRIRLLVYAFIYLCLFLFASFNIKFKYQKPKVFPIIIGVLLSINSYIYAWGYSHNHTQYPYFEYMWSVIVISMIVLYKENNSFFKMTSVLIVLVASIIEMVVSAFFDDDTDIMYIFHNNDLYNNLLCLFNAAVYTGILFLYEYSFETKEDIDNSLPYIGATSFITTLIPGLIKEATQVPGVSRLQIMFVFAYFGLTCIGVVILIIVPYYIRKCSSFVMSALSSMEILCGVIVSAVFPENIKTVQLGNGNIGHWIAGVMYIGGIGMYVYEKMRENKDDLVKKTDVKEVPEMKLGLLLDKESDSIGINNVNSEH